MNTLHVIANVAIALPNLKIVYPIPVFAITSEKLVGYWYWYR